MEREKILTKSWQSQLRKIQKQLLKKKTDPVIAILGIGNDVKGDDIAGVLAVEKLKTCFRLNPSGKSVFIYNCGSVPENFSGSLRKINPDYVLMIDAGDFNAFPGEIQFIEWENIDGVEISTHTLPLSVFAGFLKVQLHCETGILLIQPANIDYFGPVDPKIESSAQVISEELFSLFG